jgi:AraC family transcriptional regulator
MFPQVVIGKYCRLAALQISGSIVEHVHPVAHGLIKLAGPNARIAIAGRDYLLNDCRFALLNAWVPHAGVRPEEGQTVRLLAFYVDLERFARDHARVGWFGRHLRMQGISHEVPMRLRRATDHLMNRFAVGKAVPQDADDFAELLILDYAAAIDAVHTPSNYRLVDYRIRRVIEQIRSNPTLSQDLNACFRMAGLSRPHFFALFRQSTGLSPRVFGNSWRLEVAMNALSCPTTPIRDLAKELGFSAPAHFTRFFVHHVGSTPSAFRRGILRYSCFAANGP